MPDSREAQHHNFVGKDAPILFVARLPFPSGGAATSRVRSLATALHLQGIPVVIVALQDSSIASSQVPAASWNGIPTVLIQPPQSPVYHGSRRPFHKKLFFAIDSRRSVVRLVTAVARLVRTRPIRCILAYNQEFEFAEALSVLARRHGIPFVQQYAEHKLPQDYSFGPLSPSFLTNALHMRTIPRQSNASLVISEALRRETVSRGSRRVLVVPALTPIPSAGEDPWFARLEPPRERLTDRFVFGYLGAGARRDSVSSLVTACYKLIREARLPISLSLVGLAADARESISRQVSSLGIADRVNIHGWLSGAEFVDALSKVDAFVWLRADDRSGRAAYPTRLPELLLSRRPVIVSPVGDVGRDFRDGVTAIFSETTRPSAIAQAMVRLVNNHALASRVGDAGARFARDALSPEVWGPRIADWLDEVCS